MTDPLSRSWEKLEKAQRIVVKFNMAKPPDRVDRFAGRAKCELVDEAVARAVLRRLRERTSAKITAIDSRVYTWMSGSYQDEFNYRELLNEFGVELVDASNPVTTYEVPGGGLMFQRYQLSTCFAEADAVVSVAKLKNHLFQGVTLTLKNLFGLPPLPPLGRTRTYFHHIVRLSYVLPDLGRITQPCLNIVDGLVGQAGREWDGEGRIANVLFAGDHPIATDACGTRLMGYDPKTDWPQLPFLRDRSALCVAAEHGYGTVNLDEIDFQSEVEAPVAEFVTDAIDPFETILSWRRTTCEQAFFYRDHQRELTDRYAGEFIILQDGEVLWHGADPSGLGSRRDLSGQKKDRALFLKLADPEEREGEHFEVYERELPKIREAETEYAGKRG